MVPHVSEPPTTVLPPPLDVLDSHYPKKAGPSPLLSSPRPPATQRRSTAPDSLPESPPWPTPNSWSLPSRPRNGSPFTRTHVRSRSSNGTLSAPLMARAHSSPVPDTCPIAARPSSPLGPPARHRSPMRKASDEPFSSFGSQLDIGETISENHELDLTPRAPRGFVAGAASASNTGTPEGGIPTSPLLNMHNTFPRSRRRPPSPLYSSSTSAASTPNYLNPPTSTPLRTSTSSPSLNIISYNEPFPSSSSFSSSSIPSTPTSFRSRSPSISSLETIEDSPDAEIEAENIARLKAAADREDAANEESAENEEGGLRRRGMGLGRSDKRKRWSVCGAERRGDLDLETIWED
ncbi:MAG: hypothetical protein L6R40_002412 [Gallowayella cf. fulva]|nr:MAG: hypothetical protein L6R40_002412 [Xanthomendoza cf. fulva]